MSRRWTLEACTESALKYKTRSEWAKQDKNAYSAAQTYGWLDTCSQHMPKSNYKGRVPTWGEDKCLQSAKQHTTYKDWRKADNQAVVAAKRLGCLDKCIAHMVPTRWTAETCLENARQYNHRVDWYREARGAFLAAKRLGVFDECVTHMTSKASKPKPTKWTKAACIESAKPFNKPYAWYKRVPVAYNKAHKQGWFEECTAHMGKQRSS